MPLNLLAPPTTIPIFSLLDLCQSFLMGLPVSRVTAFYSTHWSVPGCAFWIANLILSLTQLKSCSGSRPLTAWEFRLLSSAWKDCFKVGFCVFHLQLKAVNFSVWHPRMCYWAPAAFCAGVSVPRTAFCLPSPKHLPIPSGRASSDTCPKQLRFPVPFVCSLN